jgi:alanine racemase
MDQTIVDVTSIAEEYGPVRQGDEVVLIGQQRGAALSAEDVGRRLHTINYDVVSRILGRVPRIYIS